MPSAVTLLGLAGQKLSRGDTHGALSLYKVWVADNPQDVPARLALANVYIKEGDIDLAIAQYQVVLEHEASNLVALNNMAWFLRDSKPK